MILGTLPILSAMAATGIYRSMTYAFATNVPTNWIVTLSVNVIGIMLHQHLGLIPHCVKTCVEKLSPDMAKNSNS